MKKKCQTYHIHEIFNLHENQSLFELILFDSFSLNNNISPILSHLLGGGEVRDPGNKNVQIIIQVIFK